MGSIAGCRALPKGGSKSATFVRLGGAAAETTLLVEARIGVCLRVCCRVGARLSDSLQGLLLRTSLSHQADKPRRQTPSIARRSAVVSECSLKGVQRCIALPDASLPHKQSRLGRLRQGFETPKSIAARPG
jgi:hypothetical protein